MDVNRAGADLVKRVVTIGVEGAGPVTGAREVADQHLSQHGDTEKAIERLIATHVRILAASGFATGLGGLITMPVTLPADLGVLYVYQGRMAAAIAYLRGYDLSTDEVQSVVLLSLLGAGGATLAGQFGIDLANKAAMQALKRVPGQVFIDINKKVGFRLVTKAGTTGLVNLTKVVPVAGGFAGGTINAASTRTVARYARRNFPAATSDRPDATVGDGH